MKQDRELLVANPGSGAEPAAPLFDNDAAFFVDLLLSERQPTGEIGNAVSPFATTSGLSLGRSSMYTVSSKLV